MAIVKIGIRYCGGCNLHYERVEMIQRAQSLTGARFLFLPHEQQGLDGLIEVNGCLRACEARDRNQWDVPSRSIAEEGDLNILMEWLFTFEQKGTEG